MNMKYLLSLSGALLLACATGINSAAQQRKPAKKTTKSAPAAKKSAPPQGELSEEGLKAKFDAALTLTPEKRIEELKKLIDAYPRSPLKARAMEHLTSARAALGDERLGAGDAEGGIKLFDRAVSEAPPEISDKLFIEVISQLPANLFIRGQREAAFELARTIEKRVAQDPKRLLVVAAFYLSVEEPAEAVRLAEAASLLAPDMAAAHLALGRAHRLSLQLDKAEASFRRALELDAQSAGARHHLADLARAAGKPDEALALYRQLLTADAQDQGARNGVVLALFESGKREEAERELDAALAANPQNLPLLVGAAWWYLSHDEMERAARFAEQAVSFEPRYTWAQIVFARTLVAQKRPLDAEQALRFARQYGRFPTLDYELANTLAAAGLYEEAAEELARTFTLRDGQLETRLAGRTPAVAENFIDLLAAERRASISQPSSPDTPGNARMLKGLLTLYLATADAAPASVSTTRDAKDDAKPSGAAGLKAATAEFVSNGAEAMRAFRQLYAAARLARHNISSGATPLAPNDSWQTVLEATDAAMSGIEAALNLPSATVAIVGDELRDYRARANASGANAAAPDLPRNILSNIMRGRVEDLAGWALFHQGKTAEAVVRLRRATSVLPADSPWWRTAQWHLGAALDASGNPSEALNAYIKSYNPRSPDPARRAFIERVYQRINGTLDGLDAKLGANALTSAVRPADLTPPPPATTTTTTTTTTTATPAIASDAATTAIPATTAPSTTPLQTTTPTPLNDTTTAIPTNPPTTPPATAAPSTAPPATAAPANATPTVSQPGELPVASPSSTPVAAPEPAREPQPAPTPTPTPEATPMPERQTPAGTTPDAPSPTPRRRIAGKHKVAAEGDCQISVSESGLTINQGGSALVHLRLEGLDNASGIKAATPDWAHIVLLVEPRADSDAGNAARYTISSIGKTPGVYTVAFSSPCGAKQVAVTVK